MGQTQSKPQSQQSTVRIPDAQQAVASGRLEKEPRSADKPDNAAIKAPRKRPYEEAREDATRKVKRLKHVLETPAQQLLPANARELPKLERRSKHAHRLAEIDAEQSTPSKKPKLAAGDGIPHDCVPPLVETSSIAEHRVQPEKETSLVDGTKDSAHTSRGPVPASPRAAVAAGREQRVERQPVKQRPNTGSPVDTQPVKAKRLGLRALISAQLRSPPPLPPAGNFKWPTIGEPVGELLWPTVHTGSTIVRPYDMRRGGIDEPISLPSGREIRRAAGKSEDPVIIPGSCARAHKGSAAGQHIRLPSLAGPQNQMRHPLRTTKSKADKRA